MTFIPNTDTTTTTASPQQSPTKKAKTNASARVVSRLRSALSEETDADVNTSNPEDLMELLAKDMKRRASKNEPFTNDEIQSILKSVQNVLELHGSKNDKNDDGSIDMEGLSDVLKKTAHYTHKEWDRTLSSSKQLKDALLPNSEDKMTLLFQTLMERCLSEGNWYGALDNNVSKEGNKKPWVVLVTGCNGIRKTTSIYQSWFSTLLEQALAPPSTTSDKDDCSDLPHGGNSFFRQLDHMLAILANEEFQSLYSLTGDAISNSKEDKIPQSIIDKYSLLKDGIFTRYRTLAEMMGIVLCQLGQKQNINIMVETSGRDIAMFNYIDRFFPTGYNKLALNFKINDLSHAESSVDNRMIGEIQIGVDAIATEQNDNPLDIKKIIYANAGGPYGSNVLKGVQADSNKVWEQIINNTNDGDIGSDWYKACIEIQAYNDKDWTACAIKHDGSKGDSFTFSKK